METGLMADVLKQLGFEEVRKQQRPLLASDYIFTPRFPLAEPFKPVYERVSFQETPLAVVREIHLQHSDQPHTSAKVTLALCWNGFADAMTLLERFVNSFQRSVPAGAVRRNNEIGDFSVLWSWGEPAKTQAEDALAMVRFNVLLAATGHDTEPGFLIALAQQADRELRALPTTQSYADQAEGLLSGVRKREAAPRVPAGGRLDLGEFATEKEGISLFFLSSSGAVNRDPESTQKWYYRAGVQRGAQEITLYRVGKGILPQRERLKVEVF